MQRRNIHGSGRNVTRDVLFRLDVKAPEISVRVLTEKNYPKTISFVATIPEVAEDHVVHCVSREFPPLCVLIYRFYPSYGAPDAPPETSTFNRVVLSVGLGLFVMLNQLMPLSGLATTHKQQSPESRQTHQGQRPKSMGQQLFGKRIDVQMHQVTTPWPTY
jgi:hypothetical protein